MNYNFDDNVIATTVGEYVLFGLPVRASVSTFSGEYDLFSPHGAIAENDEGIELWFEGDPDGPESGIFIRGAVERGVVGDLIAREIDTIDTCQVSMVLTSLLPLASMRLFLLVTRTLLGGLRRWRCDPRVIQTCQRAFSVLWGLFVLCGGSCVAHVTCFVLDSKWHNVYGNNGSSAFVIHPSL